MRKIIILTGINCKLNQMQKVKAMNRKAYLNIRMSHNTIRTSINYFMIFIFCIRTVPSKTGYATLAKVKILMTGNKAPFQ